MVTYVVLGNFTDQGVRAAKDSPKRAEAFKKMAATFGVTVKELFWTQGRYDVVTILDAPDEFSAMTLNLSLGALGNVRTEFVACLLGGGHDEDCREDALTAAAQLDHPSSRGLARPSRHAIRVAWAGVQFVDDVGEGKLPGCTGWHRHPAPRSQTAFPVHPAADPPRA